MQKLYLALNQPVQKLDSSHAGLMLSYSKGNMEAIMERGGYGQFCPVAMAAEIVCSRWTTLVIRELLCGSTRFNDLRRGVPRMSPTLLSKRLKELEEAGIIAAVRREPSGTAEYHLTEAGEDLRPIIMALGVWGQHWVDANLSLRNLDPQLLMLDMRRSINPDPLPRRRCTIQFHYPELSQAEQHWWLVVDPDGTVDLCSFDPGNEVDLYVKSSLRAMTSVWMGLSTVESESAANQMEIEGDREMRKTMQQWLGLSVFAKEKSRRGKPASAMA